MPIYYLSLSFIACISNELNSHIIGIKHYTELHLLYSIKSNPDKKTSMRATAKISRARAGEHSFKFCGQLKILMGHSSPLTFSVVVVDLPTDCILSSLFPAETDVLAPVFPQSRDVVVVNFVAALISFLLCNCGDRMMIERF